MFSSVNSKRRYVSDSMKRRQVSVIPATGYDRGMSEKTAPASARVERRDRARNRERLIEAAKTVFSSTGLHAPLDRIAARAGVGPGTLYRHFPSRAALWSAVLADPLRQHLAAVETALADADPWDGFAGFILAMCGADARPGGYPDLLNTRFDDAPDLRELRVRIQRGVTRIVARAHAAGAIRADVTAEDLYFVIASNAAVATATRGIAPDAWRRNTALYLDAFRPQAATPLPVPPLYVRELTAIVAPEP